MPSYLARNTFLPRAFIYASNEDALIVQSVRPESRITLINARGSNTMDPIFHLSASNDLFRIVQTSNEIATFHSKDNTGYLRVAGMTVSRSMYLEDPKKRQLVLYDTNTNDAFAGIGYTGGNMTFQIPSATTTGYLFQAADGAQNIPLVQMNYDPATQETRFGIGNQYPTKALDVYGDIYATGTVVTSNLRVIGQTTILDTVTSNTEQIVVTNSGDGPALHVTQTGANSIAEFYDGNEIVLMVDDNRKVGINTMHARMDLDVYGSAIVSGNLGIGTVIPRAPIDVVGDIQFSGNLYRGGELIITNTFTSWIIDANSNVYNILGNVGIGTTISPELLTLYNGNLLTNQRILSTYTSGAPFSIQSTYLNSNLNVQYLNYQDSSYYRNVDNMNQGVLPTVRGGTGSNYQTLSKLLVGGGASNPLLSPHDLHWDFSNRRLGIGLTAPQERLHLDGNLLLQSSNVTLLAQRTFGTQQTVSHVLQTQESLAYLSLNTDLLLWSFSNTSSLRLGTNNTERVRIQADGNLGIGTTVAFTKLHVVGDESLVGNLGIGTTYAPIGLYVYTRDAMRVPNGNTSERPTGQLGYIRYNTQVGQFEGFGPGNQWGSLSTVQSVNGDTYLIPEYSPGNDDKAIHFYTSNIEHLTLDRNGNLGIGSTNPQVRLVVSGTDALQVPKGTTAERPGNPGKGYLRFNTTLDKFEGYGENNTWGSVGGVRSVNGDTYITAESTPGADDKTLRFYTNSAVRTIINSLGNVGIGTTLPITPFHVQNQSYFVGNVGIGTIYPTSTLSVGTGPSDVTSTLMLNSGDTATNMDKIYLTYVKNGSRIGHYAGWNVTFYAGQSNTSVSPTNGNFRFYTGGTSYNEQFTILNAGNIGIGSTQPTYKLDVQGNMYVQGNILHLGNLGIGTLTPLQSLHVQQNGYFVGNVGIGTTVPRQALDVERGNVYVKGNIGIGTTLPLYPLDVYGGIKVGQGSATAADTTLLQLDTQRAWRFVQRSTGDTTALALQCTSTGKNMYIQDAAGNSFASFYAKNTADSVHSNVNWFLSAAIGTSYSTTTPPTNSLLVQTMVGIGTTQPREALEVSGNALVTGNLGIGTTLPQGNLYIGGATTPNVVFGGTSGGNTITLADTSYLRIGGDQLYKTHVLLAGESYGGGDQGRINIRYKNYVAFDTVNGVSGSGTEKIRMNSVGNVGIGTTLPREKLEIQGSGLLTGNLGIGTTSIQSPLDLWVNQPVEGVASGIQVTTSTANITYNSVTGSALTMNIIKPQGILPLTTLAKISYGSKYASYGAGSENNGVLFFDTANNGTLSTKLTITGDGLVGIGTTLPINTLDVLGKTYISGNLGIGTTLPVKPLHVEGTSYYNGSVGISTKTPLQNLHVEGKAYVSGNVGIGSSTPTFTLDVNGNCHINGGSKIVVQNSQDGGSTRGIFLWADGDNNWGMYLASSGATKSLNNATACVGAGFTSYAVRVRTASVATQGFLLENSDEVCNFSSRGSDGLAYIRGSLGIGTQTPRATLDTNSGIGLFGNVGVGTTLPVQPLDVRGVTISTKVGVNTLSPVRDFHVEGESCFLNGNVGIATNTPIYPFHVYSADHVLVSQNGKLSISKSVPTAPTSEIDIMTTAASSSYSGVLLRNSGNTTPTPSLRVLANRYDGDQNASYAANIGLARYNVNDVQQSQCPLGALHFGGNHTSAGVATVGYMASIQGIADGTFASSTSAPTSLGFYTGSNAYLFTDTTSSTKGNEVMRVTYDGKVGIQTKSPLYTFDVRGNSIFSGNVGIGTTIPLTGLSVYQDTNLGSGLKGEYNSYNGGPFYKQKGWDTAGTSHTITFPEYCVAHNSSGTLHIQVKSATNNKLGNVSLSFLKAYGSDVDTFSIYYHKTDNLTTFTLAVSGNNIVVTTDSDCSMCWSSIGAC